MSGPIETPPDWQSTRLTFTTPKGLPAAEAASDVTLDRTAVLLIVDPFGHLHAGRGFRKGGFPVKKDRPQRVAAFRAKLTTGSWLPPLVLFTRKPAKSVNTRSASTAFELAGFWFVDGNTLRCGLRQAAPDSPSA